MTDTPIFVQKRNGEKEQLDLEKIHVMVQLACEGITGVSESSVEMNSGLQFYDGISTREIQEILIKSAADLISLDNPNYQYVAARLRLFALRKEAWRQNTPPHIVNTIVRNIGYGVYDKDLLDLYTDDEWEKINKFIKHERDLDFTFGGIQQIYDKYLVQDRVSGKRYETPQHMYILIAAVLFANYPNETKLKYVKKYYDAISTFKISLPTPIVAGIRTPIRQFASCVLIDIGDSMNSIFSSTTAVGYYVAQRAGIGLNAGRIRAKGSKIRGGEVKHTGVIPFLKVLEATTKSCTQSGLRGGSSTTHFPIFHLEIEDILVLKNNQGTEDNRVRHLDYSIQLSKLFYQRYIDDKKITLFSPHEVPDLYEAFGKPEFDELYIHYENKRGITKKKVKARELFHTLLSERQETGRIYIMNMDNVNQHSHTVEKIYFSNLCQEITLATAPINHIDDTEGRIATCILSALNVGTIKDDEYEEVCDLAIRGLDQVIDYQKYPVKAAELYTNEWRTLGVGIINFAYYLAKNKVKWDSDEARELTHKLAEKIQYNLLKASNNLAKEKGKCPKYDATTYANGLLPIDTYKRDIDEFANFQYQCDWEALRASIAEHGLRNACVTALMPSEASSVVSGATNGIEPPREFITIKRSKTGDLKMVVPEYSKLKNFYELLFNMESTHGYLKLMAIIQKFVDQSISTNTSYNPAHYEDNEIPMSVLARDVLLAYKWGIKTLYYSNTNDLNDGDTDGTSDNQGGGCDSGACSI